MLEIQIQEHTNNIVKKHNDLVKAQGALSSTAQKMLCSVISMIRADDGEFQEYALKRDEYLNLIGSSSNNDEFIYRQAEELMSNPFKIDGKMFNWCSMVDFKRIPGYIIFDIHSKLKPYLLELKEKGGFTQYKIMNILSLSGDYSIRLYEFFIMEWNQYKAYNPNSKSYTFELKIDKLIEDFQIPKSYKYNDIRRRIIDKAKQQFKEKTDIQFEYKEQKIGRKVDRLIITLKSNDKGSNDNMQDLHSFIAYMRKNFINKDILEAIDTNSKEKMLISVSEKGILYDKFGKEFNASRSKEIWASLYQMAKEDKLFCLKQASLF